MICGTPAAPFLSANNKTIALKFEVSGPSGNDREEFFSYAIVLFLNWVSLICWGNGLHINDKV